MEKSQKDAIRKCRVQIVEDLLIGEMGDHLISSDIFTALMLEEIKSERSRPDKVRALLDKLPMRGPNAFPQFLECLNKSGHRDLADILIAKEIEVRGEHVPESLKYHNPQLETCSEDIEMKPRFEKTGTQPTSNHGGYTRNLNEEYKMKSVPLGFLFVINNINFNDDSLPDRQGSEKDCADLKDLFTQLGFGVDVQHNLTTQQIKDILQKLSQLPDLEEVDCLAVAILTHGQKDSICGVDGQDMMTQDVFRPFTTSKCPQLLNKPKLFIINACRIGDPGNPDCEDTDGYSDSGLSEDTEIVPPGTTSQPPVPDQQDFLLAYSTTCNDNSWIHDEKGSLFIQSIVDVFSKFASTIHVPDMLIKVNKQVAEKARDLGYVQIPAHEVSLTRRWFLNPRKRTPFEVKPECVPV